MSLNELNLPLLVIGLAVALSWPLGRYMAWLMNPGPREGPALFDRLLGAAALEPQDWKSYGRAMLTFNVWMFVSVYLVLICQAVLPLNPDNKPAVEATLALHTAASFTANTNLQHYSGEVALSYFSQLALMWLQFVSAATGIAALAAIARSLGGSKLAGNFFQDLFRATAMLLLPLAGLWALFLSLSGVPMTFEGAAMAETLEGPVQMIARGPVSAFVAIKQLGTNGGGFFGPNAAHPLENPSFWTNVAMNLAIVLIPMASVWMFGQICRRQRHAAVLFATMLLIYLSMLGMAWYFESAPTAAFRGLPVAAASNLEGKELRFGSSAGPLWAVSTTATSNGSVNCMHDSLNPLTGLAPMIGMWLNVAFGGVGVGVINMLIFVVVAVFLAGMMVGRTPEYLARKVEVKEMKLALVALLAHPVFILGGTALFASTHWGQETIQDPGSHGFSEIVYEISSAAANNGSGFEGLRDNTAAWNIATGVIMLLARFIPIIAPLALAASLASKNATSESSGTFRTDTWLFGLILLGTVLIVGALLFMPLAMLGPIAEHLGST